MYSVKPEIIKQADELANEKYGICASVLMTNACLSVYEKITPFIPKNKKIAVLCGKGNNAGDGYGVASLLYQNGYNVCAVRVFSCEPCSDEAKEKYKEFSLCGGKIIDINDFLPHIFSFGVFIDAVFGVGFSGSVAKDSDLGQLFELCNSTEAFQIAIDVPSGINSTDGTLTGACFKAELTACIALYKTGLLSYPAREYAGEIVLCDIGFPKELTENLPKHALIPDDEYLKNVIPKRHSNSHKGSYGKLLLFCASPSMTGAGYLSCMGALRSGCGLVNIASDDYTISVLQQKLNEPIFSRIYISSSNGLDYLSQLADSSSAVLCGCGLGNNENTKNAIFKLIKTADTPLLIDADGINVLCENINILKEAKHSPIITPHPAEFARLIGKTTDEVQSDRINLAVNFAKEYGCITVLKGASTIIASPDGRLAINIAGNAGLAKGGSGDVLAGICAGLLCQGINAFDAAVAGVYLHAKAADILKERIGEYGLLPSDIPLEVAKLLP